MNIYQLSDNDKTFIKNHENDDLCRLSLQKHKFENSNIHFLIEQISARQHAKKKLPTWCNNYDLIFPPSIRVEQSSSELTADYKATLCGGDSLIDLTCGFGVDTFALSRKFRSVNCLDSNEALISIIKHNAEVLQLHHIEAINDNCVHYLENVNEKLFDWIFIDPSRRDDGGTRFSSIEDYSPNILEIKKLLFDKGNNIMIKLSPMLEIKQLLRFFPETNQIHIISIDNECKEILLMLRKDSCLQVEEIPFFCVNFDKKGTQLLQLSDGEEQKSRNHFKDDGLKEWENFYLYEPNSSIMKSGLYFSIADIFHVSKIHYNSHLYISSELVEQFPGRIFKIEKKFSDFRKDTLKSLINYSRKMNLTVRNFPMSVEQLRDRLQLKEGGDFYLFATTTAEGHTLILSKKIK